MKILRTSEVIKLTGLSRTTIWRLERKNKFPNRIQLTVNAVGWDEKEVIAWLESRRRGVLPQREELAAAQCK